MEGGVHLPAHTAGLRPDTVKHHLSDIWDQTLSRLESEVAKPSFDMWLRRSKPVELNGETLYVSLPEDYMREWVEARYTGPIRRTLRQVVGKDWDLRWVTATTSDESPSTAVPESGSQEVAAAADPAPKAVDEGPISTGTSNGRRGGRRSHTVVVDRPTDDVASGILNPRYTFDTFVVGSSNRFAHAASLAVAEAPGRAYNPLFIYGGVGLGKTHLMQAIGHHIIDQKPRARVVYVSTETFTNHLVDAIARKSTIEFRQRYRSVDALLIDDIQFIAGKEGTQEEFFHTFNALYEANNQIVISSDRPPKEIPTLEERLRSRFEWGLTADIQQPDLETRTAILRRKASSDGLTIPNEVLAYIADQIPSNIRELEGTLNRVIAFSTLHKLRLDLETATMALKDLVSTHRRRQISIEYIQQIVAEHYGIKVGEMRAQKRTRSVAFPRQVAMYLTRELTDSSLPKVGEEFGGRDHTTVIHACDRINTEIQADPSFQATIRDLIDRIRQG